MKTKSKVRLVTGILVGLCLGTANGAPAVFSCADLEGAEPRVQLEYLQRDRSTLGPGCICFAMDRLGLKHYAPAVKTLIKYLDYRVPEDPAKARMAVISRIPTLGDIYPAATALFEIGKPAISDLVAAIADSGTSDVARSNAIEVLFDIHGNHVSEAVALLYRAGEASTDAQAAYHLKAAARRMADKCRGEQVNACLNALR